MRVSEVYTSIQGEGPRVGIPTTFVRFGGCNLKCPGWPCDSQHAIDPQYRAEWKRRTPAEVFHTVQREHSKVQNICLTGGEPFLQPTEELESLCRALAAANYHVECFSNGTLLYPWWAVANVAFVMDWKLPGSGEDHINPNRFANLKYLITSHGHSVKFVIKDEYDYQMAKRLWKAHLRDDAIQVFAGVVWGKLAEAELVEWMLTDELPWRLNVQVHQHIWPVDERRR